jgi:hypothetical protein
MGTFSFAGIPPAAGFLYLLLQSQLELYREVPVDEQVATHIWNDVLGSLGPLTLSIGSCLALVPIFAKILSYLKVLNCVGISMAVMSGFWVSPDMVRYILP